MSRSADAFYSLKRLDAKQAVRSPIAACPPPAPEKPLLFAKQGLRTTFYARCETMWGDKVFLVGSSPQLGEWDPKRSCISLSTDSGTYPMWQCSCDLELPSSGEPLEYKVVIVRSSLVEWEPLGDNRKLAPNPHHVSKAAHVHVVWGEAGASLQWRWEW